jgi:hypothetical protein
MPGKFIFFLKAAKRYISVCCVQFCKTKYNPGKILKTMILILKVLAAIGVLSTNAVCISYLKVIWGLFVSTPKNNF